MTPTDGEQQDAHRPPGRFDRLMHSFDMVAELDESGAYVEASPNVKRILGHDPEDLIGLPATTLIHPDDLERLQRDLVDAFDLPEPKLLDYRVRHADGSWRHLESTVTVSDTPDGRRALVVARDVTERRRIQDALAVSEERLNLLIRNAPVVLFAINALGTFTAYEGAGMAALGLAPGALVGRSVYDVCRDHPALLENVRRALAGETFSAHAAFGDSVFETYHAPVRDDSGAIVGIIGVGVDATQRVRGEQALRRESELRELMMTHATDAIAAFDVHGCFQMVNERLCEITGYASEELIGQGYAIIARDSTDVARFDGFADLLRERAPFSVETRIVRKDGAERLLRINLAHMLKDDVVTGAVGIGRDITEQRWSEMLVAGQRSVLEMMAAGEPLPAVLEALTGLVESLADGVICSVLLLDDDGCTLRHASAPNLPAEYCAAIDGAQIGPNVGSCGTAAWRGETVIVEDIDNDPLWADFRALAADHGLRACWSTPILMSDGSVAGTFAMYYREPRAPRDRELDVINMAGRAAALAVGRERSERAVRARTAELEDSRRRLEEKSLLLERALEQERERARRDPLTGALNHAAITQELADVLAARDAAPVGVAMLDVDGLKAANDTYGHQVGDQVLVTVARELSRSGAIVGRYGGDEFVAILPEADRAAAERYRSAVLAALEAAGLTDAQSGAHVPIVASIGLAIYPEEAVAVDDLIRLSDAAMYASRRSGQQGNGTLGRAMGGDRAAKMVGEIVPLLTSPGDVQEKLRLVAHRLSVGAGYAGVNFVLADADRLASSAFARAPNADIDTWNRRIGREQNPKVTAILQRTLRPVVIDHVASTDLLNEQARAMLGYVGIRSAIIAPMLWQGEVIGALSVGSKDESAFSVRDVEFLMAVATQVTAIVRMATLLEDLRESTDRIMRAHTETVLMLAGAAEAHDHTTGRHLQRVRTLVEALALQMGYDQEHASELGLAGVLHDIGKIRVPDMVLGSREKLADSEWVLMKQHTLWGSEFLSGQQGFELASQVARCHHERWDGEGYPAGLRGDDIPEAAQITAVADAFDAMTNDRPYRRGRPLEEAVAEIVRCSGAQFSPRIVDALAALHARGALDALMPLEDDGSGEEWMAA